MQGSVFKCVGIWLLAFVIGRDFINFLSNSFSMINFLKKLRVGKNEIIADIIFLFVAMAVSAIAIFIFDIHWSFYPGNTIFPPNKYIFKSLLPYYFGIPVGGIVGFILLKLVVYAFFKEEEEYLETHELKIVKRQKTERIKNSKNRLN